ncbi:DUF4142 domain-containing protein [Pontibacter oryzae]|uniref:DUF4142 domain-containing protein n=1 Tax=Pontibacter oryzae TaxID=2304593 RepID=A0A399SMA5_9BACT|nr:DUF4142 domain-containing protein [Pontibacter oryzae]RIJ42925.1 DUF4142 domain-containing protein [Pontibacter oryzae]
MKKIGKALGCIAALAMLASCSSGSDSQNNEQAGTVVVATDSTLTEDNQELLAFAARNNMLQIELGRLATAHGASENVKTFGQELITWYSDKQQELQTLAQQYNITLPQQLADDQSEQLKELREANAREFDQAYWDSVIEAQKEAVDEFDDELKRVEDTNASAFSIWARNTLQELRAQLVQAEAHELELKNRDGGITESL